VTYTSIPQSHVSKPSPSLHCTFSSLPLRSPWFPYFFLRIYAPAMYTSNVASLSPRTCVRQVAAELAAVSDRQRSSVAASRLSFERQISDAEKLINESADELFAIVENERRRLLLETAAIRQNTIAELDMVRRLTCLFKVRFYELCDRLKISITSTPTVLKWATEFRRPCAINAVRQLFGCRVQQASSVRNFTLSCLPWMLSEDLKKNTFSCCQTHIQV